MLFDILCLVSLLVVILNLKRLVNIFPSLMACIIRWKESVNLEASAKLSRDRDFITLAMIVPFCLTIIRFDLYAPAFMSGMDENPEIWTILSIFSIYLLFRFAVSRLFHPQKIGSKTLSTAAKSSNTFFIILTLILLAMGGIMTFTGVDDKTIKLAMLWVSMAIYAIHIIRKIQIFNSSCSIFTAFLYLCALEIIPTGIIVVSAIIL
jgi:hypothetical protein